MREPGRYLNVEENEYHSDDAINRGQVVRFLQSPAHWLAGEEDYDGDALRFGSAFHKAVLEPDEYDPIVVDVKGTRTKTFKAALSDNPGHIVVTQEEQDAIESMKSAVYAHPTAAQMLDFTKGDTEVSYWWDDPVTGVRCRCRVDYDGPNYVVDLKSTSDVEAFRKSCYRYHYDTQAPFYLDGANEHREQPAENFYFVAVQKPPRYGSWAHWHRLLEVGGGIRVFDIAPESVQDARQRYREALAGIQQYQTNEKTYAGVTGVQTIHMERYQ